MSQVWTSRTRVMGLQLQVSWEKLPDLGVQALNLWC